MTGDAVPDAPDFARLYADPGSPLSPRMASRLWAAAVMLADTYRRAGGTAHAVPAAGRATLGRRGVMERFVACFDALARRFEQRQVDATQIATCTGEEMPLHLVIEEAEGTAGVGSLDTDLSLPADPDRDEDFGAVRELLFRLRIGRAFGAWRGAPPLEAPSPALTR